MEITLIGFIFLPLGIYSLCCRKSWLLPLLIFASIFQGAAVVNLSGGVDYGLSPYYFLALLVSSRLWAATLAGGVSVFRRRWIPFAAFSAIAIAGAFILPVLFQGMPVFNPREGIDEQQGDLSSLTLTLGNVSHTVYLFLNISVLVAFYQEAQKHGSSHIERAIHISGFIVCAVGMYQLLHMMTGIFFPFETLYSNIQVRKEMVTDLTGYQRVFSTFPEPSYFSAFLASYIFFFLARKGANLYKRPIKMSFLISLLVLLFLSGSSTGYAAFMLAGIAWYIFGTKISAKAYIFRVSLALAFVFAIFYLPEYFPLIQTYIYAAVLEKNSSASAGNRLAADLWGLTLTTSTFGFGVGLGANATSSLVTMLLSNCGILGCAMFMIAVFKDVKKFKQTEERLAIKHQAGVGLWAFVAVMCAMFVAIPYVNWPILWIIWGVVLALTTSAKLENRFLTASTAVQ